MGVVKAVQPPRITKLWAKNFRNLEDVEVALDPLTVLVGPNASGKSNIVDVLRFVSDALNDDLDSAITNRHGMGAIRRWSAKGRPYDVEIGLRAEGPEVRAEYSFILGSAARGEYRVKREHSRADVTTEPKPMEFEIRDGKVVRPEGLLALPPGFPPPSPTELASSGYGVALMLPGMGWIETEPTEQQQRVFAAALQWVRLLRNMQFYHMFPNVLRVPQKPGSPHPLDEHGENLASVLREMVRSKSPQLPDLREALGKVVPGISDFQVYQVGGYLVARLKHERAAENGHAWFDLSQESDGTLRVLGLLVALFQEPPPSLIAIEEPELTIHPGALAVLADIILEATRRTQVLVTTHSPDLIDRFPVESLRAVEVVDGATRVGPVAEHQREAVKRGLFSTGELHRMEGLKPASGND